MDTLCYVIDGMKFPDTDWQETDPHPLQNYHPPIRDLSTTTLFTATRTSSSLNYLQTCHWN